MAKALCGCGQVKDLETEGYPDCRMGPKCHHRPEEGRGRFDYTEEADVPQRCYAAGSEDEGRPTNQGIFFLIIENFKRATAEH